MAEATRLGFTIKPPHINHSQRLFSLSYESAAEPSRSIHLNHDSPTLWMGLGQVRHLRRQSVRTIVAEREKKPFSGLSDLVQRVTLQKKELIHLVQCGALDGLGPSRMKTSRSALLARAAVSARAGATQQMTFAFAHGDPPPESPADRLQW